MSKLKDFAIERAALGSTLTLPVQYLCTDGHVAVMPGDDAYPNDVHLIEYREVNQTMEQFRKGVKNLHRVEYTDMNNCNTHITFKFDGHLHPLNIRDFKAKL